MAEQRYRIAPQAEAVEVGGEVVVWDGAAQALHLLNVAATVVWRALGEWATREDVVEHVCAATGATAGDVVADIEVCLAHLVAEGLVVAREP
jgi:hypothetical protein